MLKNNLLLALILSFLFFSQAKSQNVIVKNPEPNTLEEAIDNVKRMIQQGSTKKEIAEYVTQTVSNRLTFLNHKFYQKDGNVMIDEDIENKVEYFNIWRNNNIDLYEVHASATWAWENRMGQCNEAANTAFHILVMAYKSAEEIIPVNMENHRYVILGDKYNIPNPFYADDLRKLNNSYVIDPWAGQSFSTKILSDSKLYQGGEGSPQDEGSYRAYKIRYDKWLVKCKENPVKYQDWLHGTSNYKPLASSSVNNTGDARFKCPDNNPDPGNTKDQYFPKNHEGTYVKCRYHFPDKLGKSILGSKIGYHENKKVIAEYFDSRNFLFKRIQYDGDGKKSEVTTFYDIGKPSSYRTYKPDGTTLIYKAWYKDGRKKF